MSGGRHMQRVGRLQAAVMAAMPGAAAARTLP